MWPQDPFVTPGQKYIGLKKGPQLCEDSFFKCFNSIQGNQKVIWQQKNVTLVQKTKGKYFMAGNPPGQA